MSDLSSEKKKVSGILYAEDFGDSYKVEAEKTEDKPIIVEEKKDVFPSKEILDEHYNNGVQEGRRIEKEISDNEKKGLENSFKETVISTIKEIDKKIDKNTNDISKEISFVMFKALMSLFPNMLRKYGIEESQNTINGIIPIINKNYIIKLTCSKDFFEKIRLSFPEGTESRIKFILDEEVKDGDFKISWDTGYLLRNADETIRKIISELSLSPLDE